MVDVARLYKNKRIPAGNYFVRITRIELEDKGQGRPTTQVYFRISISWRLGTLRHHPPEPEVGSDLPRFLGGVHAGGVPADGCS